MSGLTQNSSKQRSERSLSQPSLSRTKAVSMAVSQGYSPLQPCNGSPSSGNADQGRPRELVFIGCPCWLSLARFPPSGPPPVSATHSLTLWSLTVILLVRARVSKLAAKSEAVSSEVRKPIDSRNIILRQNLTMRLLFGTCTLTQESSQSSSHVFVKRQGSQVEATRKTVGDEELLQWQ